MEEYIAMKICAGFVCIIFLVSMIALGSVQVAEAQSEEKESDSGASVSEEQPSNENGVIMNSIGMKLKLIEPGEFMMGSDKGQDVEKPVHKVRITKAFYIGVYEVTQEQYEKIMGENPSYFRGANIPVDSISWDDAVLFCKRLSEKEGVTYRLPTEAEWEYACRAGTRTRYYWGDEMDNRYAWTTKSGKKSHDVGQKKPNAWGLYDMSGNVWEWCSDRYGDDYYDNSPEEDPGGPRNGFCPVTRGGSWLCGSCSSASRWWNSPDFGHDDQGFRVVRTPE